MDLHKHIKNSIPPHKENPFKVPDGYFENLHERVMDKVRNEDLVVEQTSSRKFYLGPYLALAASISGLALVVYIILQSISATRAEDNLFYDVALLDEAGVILDESAVAETYINTEDDTYTDWEEEAMTYLASNEVDLFHLLASN